MGFNSGFKGLTLDDTGSRRHLHVLVFKIRAKSFNVHLFVKCDVYYRLWSSVLVAVYRAVRYRDSSVGIATPYGVDESRWGRDFRILPDRPWGPPSRLYSGYRVCFPEVRWMGRGVYHPPHHFRG